MGVQSIVHAVMKHTIKSSERRKKTLFENTQKIYRFSIFYVFRHTEAVLEEKFMNFSSSTAPVSTIFRYGQYQTTFTR